jgi:hypothetical protein
MFFLLLLPLCSSQACPSYACAKQGDLSSGVCIGDVSGLFLVSSCTDLRESYCPPIFTLLNTTCTTPPIITNFAYPGEKCKQASDCKFGHCVNNFCFGQEYLSSCQVHGECNPGLRCDPGLLRCLNLFGPSDQGCASDYDCQPGMGCDLGFCRPYYSVADYNFVENCTDSTSDICRSGQCAYGMCIPGLHSQGTLPVQCGQNSDCRSVDLEDEGMVFYSSCACGYNEKGYAYCYLFMGDRPNVEFIRVRNEWLKANVSWNCNTVRRWEGNCMISHYKTAFAYRYLYYMYNAQQYPLLAGAQDCVTQIVFPSYYQSAQEVSGNGRYHAVLFLSLILNLLL